MRAILLSALLVFACAGCPEKPKEKSKAKPAVGKKDTKKKDTKKKDTKKKVEKPE